MPRAWRLPSETVHAGQRMGKRTAGTALGAMPAVVSFPGAPTGRTGHEQGCRAMHALTVVPALPWVASPAGAYRQSCPWAWRWEREDAGWWHPRDLQVGGRVGELLPGDRVRVADRVSQRRRRDRQKGASACV